jgi:uncharacterized membrane protein YfcA
MVWVWLGVFGSVAVASAAQTLSGFGFALIATPLVAVLVGPKEAVVGLTIVGPLLTTQLWLRDRGSVRRSAVAGITAAAFVGMPLGILVLTQTGERTLTMLIAVAVIAFGLLLWRGIEVPDRPATDAVAGLTSGVLATSTGTSGPPVVIALSGKRLEPSAFRATISVIFLIQSGVALLAFAVARQFDMDAVRVAIAGLPGVIVGAVVGERGFRRLDALAFRRVVLVMLLLSGVVALGGALLA